MANQRPEKGQIWRRKRNGYLVEITDVNGPHANVIYKAHEPKPRQPEMGRKYHSYFRDEFEFVAESQDALRVSTADQLDAVHIAQKSGVLTPEEAWARRSAIRNQEPNFVDLQREFNEDYRQIFGCNPEPWREPLGALRLTLSGDPEKVDVKRAQVEMEELVRVLNGGVKK